MENNSAIQMPLIPRICNEVAKRVAILPLTWKNYKLLARINKFYSENEPDATERLWLEKSRKLIATENVPAR